MLNDKDAVKLKKYVGFIERIAEAEHKKMIKEVRLQAEKGQFGISEAAFKTAELDFDLTTKDCEAILVRYTEISRDDTGDITPPDTAPPSEK